MISFIIPAYNEESELPKTLETLLRSARACGEPFEIMVVDDASEDRTAELALKHGAAVLSVNLRQIAATRNAGARLAKGDVLVFLDADTLLPEATLAAALDAVRAGAVGGGARVAFDGRVPILARVMIATLMTFLRLLRWTAGCFVFVRRDDFEAVGGFDERYFASEEIHLSRALKKRGRFIILAERVTTSARKVRLFSPWHLIRVSLRLAFGGPRALQRREGLEIWYDGDLRETKDASEAPRRE